MATCKSASLFATSSAVLETTYMETGNIALDMALTNGKGLPMGKYVILTADHGSGKTTTCIDLIKRLCGKHSAAGIPFKMMFLDIEGSQELARRVGLGPLIDNGSLLYREGPCTFEDLDQIATDINSGAPFYDGLKVIIIDSLTMIKSELETSSEKGDFGNATRARNKFYKIFLSELKRRGITLISISQVRVKQGATAYEDPKKSAVTDGDLHYADIILKLAKATGGNNAETKKVDIKTTTSDKTEKISPNFFVSYKPYGDKNRYGHFPSVTTLMKYSVGCENWYIMREILSHYKYLVNKGSAGYPKFVLSDEVAGYVGVEFPENCDKKAMKKYLRDNMGPLKEFLRSKDEYRLVPDDVVTSDDEDDEE